MVPSKDIQLASNFERLLFELAGRDAARVRSLMEALRKAKPSGAKGVYIKRISVATTMGPGVKVDANAALSLGTAV